MCRPASSPQWISRREEFPGTARAIVSAGGYLAQGCHGRLDLVYSNRLRDTGRLPAPSAHAAGDAAAGLEALASDCRIAAHESHVLSGEPEDALLEFAAQRHYDVVLLGALGHQRAYTQLVGSLTAKLIDGLDCDFVLMKPGSYVCPVRPAAGLVRST